MPSKSPIAPREPSTRAKSPDVAAEHARQLLQSCRHPLEIEDRPSPLPPALEWARSGAMELTGAPKGKPRFIAGPLASAAEGAGMVLRALSPGSELANLDAPALLGERAAIANLSRNERVSAGGAARLIETRTGPIAVNLPRDEDWELTAAWLEAESSKFATARDWEELTRRIADHEAEHLVERGRLMGLAIAPAPRTIPENRPCFTLSHPSLAPQRHTAKRIRLLDLSSLWAGPLATSLLAMAGIEVLKIESPGRPDGARYGPEEFFRLLNGNKQGCALDLHQREERVVFEALLERADIVVESSRSRAFEHLGIIASDWVQARPGRLWASITGYGRSRQWIAFGDDAAVAAGLAWSPDLDQPTPAFCGDAIADPLAGVTLAAVLLALCQSGQGGLVDLSLRDCAAHAASLAQNRLTGRLDRGSEGWAVTHAGQSMPVERPRARKQEGRPPALAGPSPDLLERWTAPC